MSEEDPEIKKEYIDHKKEIVKLINKVSYRHSNWKVFEDFLAIFAITISNAVDLKNWDVREKMYLEIIGNYDKSEVDLFIQMFSHLVSALEKHAEAPTDILGPIFHDLELHNKYKGQFFTPQTICDFMGEIAYGDIPTKDRLNTKGYQSVGEPCCGSGAMVLGLVKAMIKAGGNYQQELLVEATDIDLKCVYMTYIQFSLYGIPAKVIHGNSLTMEAWSVWYTPIYILNGWSFKRKYENVSSLVENSEEKGTPLEEPKFDINFKESKSGQLTFDF